MVRLIVYEDDLAVFDEEGVDDALQDDRFRRVTAREEVVIRHLLHEMLLPVKRVRRLRLPEARRERRLQKGLKTLRIDELHFGFRKLPLELHPEIRRRIEIIVLLERMVVGVADIRARLFLVVRRLFRDQAGRVGLAVIHGQMPMLPAGTCMVFLEGFHRRFLDLGDGVLRVEPGCGFVRIAIGKVLHGLHMRWRRCVHRADRLLQLLLPTKTVQRRLLRGEVDVVQGIIEELDHIPRRPDPLQLFSALGHHDPVEVAARTLQFRTGEWCLRIRIFLKKFFDIARRRRQDQLLLGTCHRDIEHAKLLAELVGLQLFPNRRPLQGRNLHFIFQIHIITADAQLGIHQHRIVQRARVELPAHTGEEDHRELQALRLMDRHDAYEIILVGEHRRLALVAVVLPQLLDVADVVEEALV